MATPWECYKCRRIFSNCDDANTLAYYYSDDPGDLQLVDLCGDCRELFVNFLTTPTGREVQKQC